MEKWRCVQCCKCISCHSNTPAKVIYIHVYMYMCMYMYMYISFLITHHLSFLFYYLSLSLSVSVYLSVYLFVRLSVYLSLSLIPSSNLCYLILSLYIFLLHPLSLPCFPLQMEGFESHISSLLAPNPMWSNGFLYCTMCYELKKKGNVVIT